jgi:hypothetical protein
MAAGADVVTSLALAFADDHLENGRGVFAGVSDVDHVDLPAMHLVV